MELIKYDAACRMVAEAKSIDEAQEIANRAEALRAYARQAKNRQLELDAAEIRVRAERRVGQILKALEDEGSLARGQGTRGEIKLSDLGLSGNDAVRSRNLASLPDSKFEPAISNWRTEVSNSGGLRFTLPLQDLRNPWSRADRQRAAHLRNPNKIDASDPLDKYRSPDGRRIADWRIGELRRLAVEYDRAARLAQVLIHRCPIANPNTLESVRSVFKDQSLLSILEACWDEYDVPLSATPSNTTEAHRASAARKRRVCEQCGKPFRARKDVGAAARRGDVRSNVYCSRSCAGKAIMEKRLAKDRGAIDGAGSC
jgi:hypothetical protein